MPTNGNPTTIDAGKLRDGAHIIIVIDGHEIAVAEVRHVEPTTTGVAVMLAGGDVHRWVASKQIQLATDEQVATARRERERTERIHALESFVDWLYNHPDMPAPGTIRAQASLYGPWLDQLAVIERAADAIGVQVERKKAYDSRPTATIRTEVGDVEYILYGSDDRRDVERRCPDCGEDLDLIESGALGHAPGQACTADDEPPPRGTEAGDPDAVLPADVEGHAHQRGEDWVDETAAA